MRILKERRDIVGWYWFDKMTPFDRFSVEHVSEGHKLVFADLAAEANLVDPEERLYRYSLKGNGIDSSKNIEFGPNTRFPLALDHLAVDEYCEISLQSRSIDKTRWIRPVKIYVGRTADGFKIDVLGFTRE